MTLPATGTPGAPAGTPPAAPQPITAADLNRRIQHGDPNFPRELWGKPLSEGMRYYAIMREDFMRNQQRGGQPPLAGEPAGGQPPAPAPAAPRPTPGYQPPAQPAAPANFTADDVKRIVAESIAEAMRPFAMSQTEDVKGRVAREFPDWQQFDGEIKNALRETPASVLADPETWRTAYYFIKGKFLTTNPQQSSAPAGDYDHSPFNGGGTAPVRTPPPAAPSAERPYFSEQPGAPPVGSSNTNAMHDPRVLAMARRFGVPVEEYVLWLNGNVPPMPSNGGGHA